jgi:hypothetical protein
MQINEFSELAERWYFDLAQVRHWSDFLPLIERVCRAKKGYFIVKVDGERTKNTYTVALNLPPPADVVIRRDTDNAEEGVLFVLRALSSYEHESWLRKVRTSPAQSDLRQGYGTSQISFLWAPTGFSFPDTNRSH